MDITGGGSKNGRGSWSVANEIDWGSIDSTSARADAENLMLVRRAALRAARRTVGLTHLLVAVVHDSVASAVIARELHDSWKHFHALRSYLEVVNYSPAIGEGELDQHRRAASDTPLRRAEDVGVSVSRLRDDAARDVALFRLISSRALDTGLARLAGRIATDRQRHSLSLARIACSEGGVSAGKTA